MSNFNEHSLEMAIMELFEQQGYSYVNGETVHKELSEVLLRDDLRMYLMDRYSKKGFEPRSIWRMMQFAQEFPDVEIVSPLVSKLSWTHFLTVMPLKHERTIVKERRIARSYRRPHGTPPPAGVTLLN